MKQFKNICAILALTLICQLSIGQEKAENRLNLRGPVPPVDQQYGKYKSYSIELTLNSGLEQSMNLNKAPYSTIAINSYLSISGLKKVDDGDFKIKYNLTRFELVTDEDYLESSYQRAPAYYIGIESNLEIQDKTGKVIYKRYTTPKVNKFVTNPSEKYEALIYKIISGNFYTMIEEFQGFYLFGPEIAGLRYFDIEKKKKSKSAINTDEFNQSVQVLPTLVDVDRESWPELFGEAQKYWNGFINIEDKDDEDLQKRIRFASNYDLAVTHLLLGQVDEASKYLEGIKANEKTFMGMRTQYPLIKDLIKSVDDYKKITEKSLTIDAIQSEPLLPSYKKSPKAFRYAEFLGEVTDNDSNILKGNIRILSDSPELIDFRTELTGSTFGALLGGIGSDKSSVLVFMDGQKKPKRTNLSKIKNIKDTEGRFYFVGKTGKGIGLTSVNNTKRYALFEELKKGSKLSIHHEFFPQDDYVIKKDLQDEYFSPPLLIGRKKALKEYFADCPAMIQNIDKGDYNSENKENYLKMFDDYSKLCGN